jgi:hypothetical protein
MEKKFSKSYSARENALFAKMKSRRLQRWWHSRLSKIDSDQRFWLIIFTKPSKNVFDEDKPGEWYVRFWIWDSEENKIQGESILEYTIHSKKEEDKRRYPWVNSNIAECYINHEYGRIVIRPKGSTCHFIYDFDGKLLIQTEEVSSHTAKDEEQYYSKFLTKDLFFAKNDGRIVLYQLDKLENFKPNSIFFFGLVK